MSVDCVRISTSVQMEIDHVAVPSPARSDRDVSLPPETLRSFELKAMPPLPSTDEGGTSMVTVMPGIQLHGKVSEFLSTPRKMLINGKWVDSASGKTFPTYDPSTGEVLAHCRGRSRRHQPRGKGRSGRVRPWAMAAADRFGARPHDLETRRPDRATPGRIRDRKSVV